MGTWAETGTEVTPAVPGNKELAVGVSSQPRPSIEQE